MLTERLEIRLPVESDRGRFVSLFGDEEFMVFSGGVLSADAASARFDHMVAMARTIPFAKQPIVLRSTGEIVGYCGVDEFEFDGQRRLELGYRLVADARGRGIGYEAGSAVLAVAADTFHGELLAIIDPRNEPSQRLAAKLGFALWKLAEVDGYLDQLWRLRLP